MAEQIQARIGKLPFHYREGSDHDIDAIVGMKSARTDEMRTHWAPFAKRKLAYVHNIGYSLRPDPEFPKDVHQIFGRDDQTIGLGQNRSRATKAPQVITSLPAVIVNDCVLAS